MEIEKCVCGREAELYQGYGKEEDVSPPKDRSVEYWCGCILYADCCWSGPAALTKGEAIKAWNIVMREVGRAAE